MRADSKGGGFKLIYGMRKWSYFGENVICKQIATVIIKVQTFPQYSYTIYCMSNFVSISFKAFIASI